jgi:RNA polymerase sigma-70 factor (sigma-E family)
MPAERRNSDTDFISWAASCQHRLLRATYLMTGDLQRSEDLLQEALIKVAQRWDRLRSGNPDAYIRTVLYRDHVSLWRRRREIPVPQVHDTRVSSDDDDTERQLMVRAALARLSARQRAVLVLRYFDDMTEQQTADVLGVSIGTVKSHASVGLGRLRQTSPELAELLGRRSHDEP